MNLDDVKLRLASLGYTFVDTDAWVLDFIVAKVESQFKGQCNTTAVPDGLRNSLIDMVCGEFLLGKKGSGQLTGFDLEVAVKSIKEGDSDVTFAFGSGSQTPEQRFDSLIAFLMREPDFASYRRFAW